MSDFTNDSRSLVPAKGDVSGFDKKHQEKWLIYCPAIASDTLLYMITAFESYSLRSYGGYLGVNTKGMHAEDAHTTSDFMRMYSPIKWREASHMEVAVTESVKWSVTVERQWENFQKSQNKG